MNLDRPPHVFSFAALIALVIISCQLNPSDDSVSDAGIVEAIPTTTAEALHAHISFLSDDLLQGRLPGTPGYDIAARYVASHFETLGLRPAGDDGTFFQQVPLRETVRDPSGGAITIRNASGTHRLTPRDDFVVATEPSRSESVVTAPVVFVGYGIEAPAFGINDYEGLDVDGRIVLALFGAPGDLPGEERAHYGGGATKSQTAARQGAVGLLLVHTLAFEKMFPYERLVTLADRSSMTWMQGEDNPYDPAPEINVGGVLNAASAGLLFEGAERSFEDVRAEADEAGAVPAGFALPAEITMSQRSTHRDLKSSNVVAMIEGSDPELRDEYIVFTAHLDHDGVGPEVDGDTIYNGAVDNASGTAVIMELARAFAQAENPPRRSLLFVAVTAEEKGLLGAEYFAQNPTVPKENIIANINVDGGLFFYDFADVLVYGNSHSSLGENVERAAAAMGLTVGEDPFPEQGFFVRSDHYRFVQQGIPAVFPLVGLTAAEEGEDGLAYFTGYLSNHYHQPSDDMEQPWDFDVGAKFVQFVATLTRDIDNADQRPSWNEGDFFGDLYAGGTAEQDAEGS